MRDIWEKFRAALGISGVSHRTPPTLSAPDHAAAGEGLSPQDLATAGDEGSVGNLLNALPDDFILLVLLHLPSAADLRPPPPLETYLDASPGARFPLLAEPALALP